MSDILANQDAVALAELVSDGEATPREITEAAIARIEALNPQLNAVIYPMFEKALAEASSSDLPDGPFRGVPMLLKDLSSATSAGDPNHLGIRGLKQAGYIHPSDSDLTSRYRKAGFIMAGRTNTPELGLMPTTEPLAYGPTRNPWNTDYGSGGSSGGAAAAVASGMVPAANASDGGGSIRIPAAMCGLVGLKPTRGRVPLEKASNVYVLSVQHVVCHTMRDAAAILDVSAYDGGGIALPAEPFAASVGKDPGKLRIGLTAASPREGIELHPECEAAARKTADLLESLGHSVEEVYLDLVSEESIAAFGVIWSYGVAADFGMIRERLGRDLTEEEVEPPTWQMAQRGKELTAEAVEAAVKALEQHSQSVLSWWQDHDILLTPTTTLPPPRIGELASTPEEPFKGPMRAIPYAAFTSPFNMTGQPAISLPLHQTATFSDKSDDLSPAEPDDSESGNNRKNWGGGRGQGRWGSTVPGLPVGSQLVADYGREDLLIAIGSQLETASPWTHNRSPMCP